MRTPVWSLAVLVACSGKVTSTGTTGSSTTSGPASTASSTATSSATSQGSSGASTQRTSSSAESSSPVGGSSGSTGSSSSSSGAVSSSSAGSSSGETAGPDAGTLPVAGNPSGSCTTLTLPAEAQPVDTSNPTTVVGSGTPGSCTFAALASAVSQGGIITFSCGDGLVTIPITATLTPPTTNAYATPAPTPLHIVIDGANKITLDGQNAVQILNWTHAGSWQKSQDTLTLQHIQLINGQTTPVDAIPHCAPDGGISNVDCSTGFDDGEGGALYMQDGNLRVIDCTFANNQAALSGPDTGGGAIYMYGTGSPSYIVQSTFKDNTASNAGAIGMLWAGAFIFNSLFEGNSAVGTGANNNDPSECTCINNGQNEVGSGGNGGAIYKDGGDGMNLTICGDLIENNSANEFGAGIFLTADGSNAELIIDDSVLTNNSSPITYWNWCLGVSTDNPHEAGSTTCSPSPVDSTFCDGTGANCTTTCSS